MGNIKIPKSYIISSLILIVVLTACYIFVHVPLNDQIQQKRVEFDSKNQELTMVRAKVKNLLKLKSDLNKMQEELTVLKGMIPEEENLPDVIRLLQSFAENGGAKVVSIEFDKGPTQVNAESVDPNAPKNIAINRCSLRINGSYPGIVNYINNMGKSSRLFGVQSATISPGEESGNNITVDFRVEYFNYVKASADSADVKKS